MNIAVSLSQDDTLIPVAGHQVNRSGAMNSQRLMRENRQFAGSTGVSEENHSEGFLPAFQDLETGNVYLSRTRDGRRAPFHLLDGLDDALVIERSAGGRVTAVKASVIAGFVRCNRFYTREQAALACS